MLSDTVGTDVDMTQFAFQVFGPDGKPFSRNGVTVRILNGAGTDYSSAGGYPCIATFLNCWAGPVDGAVFTTLPDGHLPPFALHTGGHAQALAIEFHAPGAELVDTVIFQVHPGNAVGVAAIPADTALYVGRSFVQRAATVDQFGNSRDEPVTIEAIGAGATLQGRTVQGQAAGRVVLVVSGAAGIDSGFVSIVPQGQAAALLARQFEAPSIFTFGLDGSSYQKIQTVDCATCEPEVGLAWVPGTGDLLFVGDTLIGGGLNERFRRLRRMSATGSDSRRVTESFVDPSEWLPSFGADSGYVYFQGWERNLVPQTSIYRMHLDGSAIERLVPRLNRAGYFLHGSVSPDGSRMAVVTNDSMEVGPRVRIVDLESQLFSSWYVDGDYPVWSPSGSAIAYWHYPDYTLHLVQPDGTGDRIISGATSVFGAGPLGWSGDGQWVIGRAQDGLHVIRASDALDLYLGTWSSELTSPAWRH